MRACLFSDKHRLLFTKKRNKYDTLKAFVEFDIYSYNYAHYKNLVYKNVEAQIREKMRTF